MNEWWVSYERDEGWGVALLERSLRSYMWETLGAWISELAARRWGWWVGPWWIDDRRYTLSAGLYNLSNRILCGRLSEVKQLTTVSITTEQARILTPDLVDIISGTTDENEAVTAD